MGEGKAFMGGESDLYSLLMTISRAHEFEADQFGALYAYRAGFNPAESVTLHEKMLQAMGEIPRGMTHPTHAERIDRVRDYLLDLRAKVRGFDLAVKALNGGDYDAAPGALRGLPRRVPRLACRRAPTSAWRCTARRCRRSSRRRASAAPPTSTRARARARSSCAPARSRGGGLKQAPKIDERMLKEAMGEYQAALSIDPNYVFAQINLGAALDDLKDKKGARVALEKAVRMAPQSKEAWNNLGAVAAEMGDTPRALEALAKATALDGVLRRRLVQPRHDLRAGEQAEGRRGRLGQVRQHRWQERLDGDRKTAPRAPAIGYNFAVRILHLAALATVLALPATLTGSEPLFRLRFATIAPEGTAWAREVKAFSREIETNSGGRIAMHVYLGGVAGDDSEMGRRMRKDQLDGGLSAGMLCQEVAPAFAVFRIPGLVQDRDEERYVQTRLFPTMREQARHNGMVLLTTGSLGNDVFLSRVPIDSMETLRKLRLWQWELDRTAVAFTRAMGMQPVTLPVNDAGKAYENGQTDGFIAVPSAVFGFQWFSRKVYMSAAAVRAAAWLRADDDGGVRSPAGGSARRHRDGVGEVRPAHRRDDAQTGRGAARRPVRQAGRALGAGVAASARAVPRRGARGARQAGRADRAERAPDAGAIVPGRLPQRAPLM